MILGNDLEIGLSCSVVLFFYRADLCLVYSSHMQFLNTCHIMVSVLREESFILSAEVDCFSWSAENKIILRS